jgi:hypothetical protein
MITLSTLLNEVAHLTSLTLLDVSRRPEIKLLACEPEARRILGPGRNIIEIPVTTYMFDLTLLNKVILHVNTASRRLTTGYQNGDNTSCLIETIMFKTCLVKTT